MKFFHAMTTTASKQQIWQIWADVENWPQWDTELDMAHIEGELKKGVIGSFQPKNAPVLPFEITECIPGETYTFSAQMPLCQLNVKRYFSENEAGQLEFIHEISFVGLLSWLFGRFVGQRIQKVLPSVMEQLRAIAE